MSQNEHAENFILFLVVGGLIVGSALYGIFLFWPYLVFYLLPFLLGSIAVGFIFRISTVPDDASQLTIHKNLVIVYPALIFLVLLAFFMGSQRAVVVDKNGNIAATYLDWPKVNLVFNDWRSSTYANSPFDSLKAKAKEGAVYDRQEMGMIAFWCLFFGGPLFFWYLSRGDEQRMDKIINKRVTERTGHRWKLIEERSEKLDQIINSKLAEQKARVSELEQIREKLSAENMKLRATVEFSAEIARPSETHQAKTGVLDSDLF